MEINKQELVKEFQIHDNDSGSTEVQIAIRDGQIRTHRASKESPQGLHTRRDC